MIYLGDGWTFNGTMEELDRLRQRMEEEAKQVDEQGRSTKLMGVPITWSPHSPEQVGKLGDKRKQR